MATTVPSVVAYLGALAAGRPVTLLNPLISRAHLSELVDRFAPAIVSGDPPGTAPAGYRDEEHKDLGAIWRRAADPAAPAPAAELALLLTTSGSTGSPKLVRLSASAVQSNAAAIVAALDITTADVAITTLPLHYTFGLSVLHSHLRAGATVVLTDSPLIQREFWSTVDTFGVTSLAAVPYQFEMMRRLRFRAADHPGLRTIVAAGGRLRPELAATVHNDLGTTGGRLYVMYGATEATARMTVLPPARLLDKLGSVGIAVPGSDVAIGDDNEVLFRGPGVMLGYADAAADLARGDDLDGVLHTGDLGRVDSDGFLYLTGRRKRLAKIFGIRVNLDDVEDLVAEHGPLAAVAGDDRVVVLVERATPERCAGVRAELAQRLNVHSSGVDVRSIDALPLLDSGKVDYGAASQIGVGP